MHGTFPTPLDRFLSEAEWRVQGAQRVEVAAGVRLDTARMGGLLLLVLDGEFDVIDPRSMPLRLASGDLLIVTDLDRTVVRARGGHATGIAGDMATLRVPADAATLPPVMYLRDFAGLEPAIADLVRSLGCTSGVRPSDSVVCMRIATTILAVAIRLWATQGCAPDGWPARVTDPFLQRALDAMHDDLAHPWTVAELAGISAMSRSSFAARFRSALHTTPGGYLTAARMRAAERLLVEGHGVSTVSRQLGYDSDDGFSRAFRRHSGHTPSTWQRTTRAPQLSH